MALTDWQQRALKAEQDRDQLRHTLRYTTEHHQHQKRELWQEIRRLKQQLRGNQ